MVTLELALEVWTGFVTTLSDWFGMGSTLLLAVAGITFIIYACCFVGAGVCAHVRDAVVRGREVRAVRAMPAPVLSWEAKPQPAASTEATPPATVGGAERPVASSEAETTGGYVIVFWQDDVFKI